MRSFFAFAFLSLLSNSTHAQTVLFGVKGGAFLTGWHHDIELGRSLGEDRSGHATIGPMVELPLFRRLRLELDALYRHEGSMSLFRAGVTSEVSDTEAASWEFAVLPKYRLEVGPLAPFVLAGPTFRRLGRQHVVSTCSGLGCGPNPGMREYDVDSLWAKGIAIGGGAEFKLGRLRLSTEVRFTRLSRPDIETGSIVLTNPNQLALLFGVAL